MKQKRDLAESLLKGMPWINVWAIQVSAPGVLKGGKKQTNIASARWSRWNSTVLSWQYPFYDGMNLPLYLCGLPLQMHNPSLTMRKVSPILIMGYSVKCLTTTQENCQSHQRQKKVCESVQEELKEMWQLTVESWWIGSWGRKRTLDTN